MNKLDLDKDTNNISVKPDYYVSKWKKVVDFLIGFLGSIALFFIYNFLNIYFLDFYFLTIIVIYSFLIFLFIKANRKFIAIGIIAIMLSCLVIMIGFVLLLGIGYGIYGFTVPKFN